MDVNEAAFQPVVSFKNYDDTSTMTHGVEDGNSSHITPIPLASTQASHSFYRPSSMHHGSGYSCASSTFVSTPEDVKFDIDFSDLATCWDVNDVHISPVSEPLAPASCLEYLSTSNLDYEAKIHQNFCDTLPDILTAQESVELDATDILFLQHFLDHALTESSSTLDAGQNHVGFSSAITAPSVLASTPQAPTPAPVDSSMLAVSYAFAMPPAPDMDVIEKPKRGQAVTGWTPAPGYEFPFVDVHAPLPSLEIQIPPFVDLPVSANLVLGTLSTECDPSHKKLSKPNHKAQGEASVQPNIPHPQPSFSSEVAMKEKHSPVHAIEKIILQDPFVPGSPSPVPALIPSHATTPQTAPSIGSPDTCLHSTPSCNLTSSPTPVLRPVRPLHPARSLSRPNLHTLLPPHLAKSITQRSRLLKGDCRAKSKKLQGEKGAKVAKGLPQVEFKHLINVEREDDFVHVTVKPEDCHSLHTTTTPGLPEIHEVQRVGSEIALPQVVHVLAPQDTREKSEAPLSLPLVPLSDNTGNGEPKPYSPPDFLAIARSILAAYEGDACISTMPFGGETHIPSPPVYHIGQDVSPLRTPTFAQNTQSGVANVPVLAVHSKSPLQSDDAGSRGTKRPICHEQDIDTPSKRNHRAKRARTHR